MKNNIEKRIKNIMSFVFSISIEEIDDESSPDTIESWDSLKQMNLVIALEEEFSIELKDNETVEMLNYLLIRSIINEKISS